MASLYHSLFTEKGLELLRTAIQSGTKLGITHMSFGDGNGVLPTPDAKFISMVKEVYRVPLNRLAASKENANWLEADGVIPSAVGGFNIREVGLWAGDIMVAYANYPPTYKPTGDQGTAQIKTVRIVLQIDNTANFELKIDASVVMATVQYVNEKTLNKIEYVENIEDLKNVIGAVDGQVIFVKKISKNYVYTINTNEPENNVTVVGKWVMETPDAYYASWFCDAENNPDKPQHVQIQEGYNYATKMNRPFVIDKIYYVESKSYRGTETFPALSTENNASTSFAIRIQSNSILRFENDGELKLKPNSNNFSAILFIFDVENYQILNAKLTGDKLTHLNSEGEQGHCIHFGASKNGYVKNPICKDAWGDGIYMGFTFWVKPTINVFVATDLVIDSPEIYNASRNGISICGASGITINDPLIDTVNRTAPMSGIDIEPEEDVNFTKPMFVEDVTIHNATFINCSSYSVMAYIVGNRTVEVNFTGVTKCLGRKSKIGTGWSTTAAYINSRLGNETVDSFNQKGYVNIQHLLIDDTEATWETYGICLVALPFKSIKTDIGLVEAISINSNPIIGFDVDENGKNSPSQGGVTIREFKFHKKIESIVFGRRDNLQGTVPRIIDTTINIPFDIPVSYINKGFTFGDNCNIGGYYSVDKSNFINEFEHINNLILTPAKSNDNDINILNVYTFSKGRKINYSLKNNLTATEIGDGIYFRLPTGLVISKSPLASITCILNDIHTVNSASYGSWLKYSEP